MSKSRVSSALAVLVAAVALLLSPVVVPIPGASRPESITDSVRAADLGLSADELAALEAATRA